MTGYICSLDSTFALKIRKPSSEALNRFEARFFILQILLIANDKRNNHYANNEGGSYCRCEAARAAWLLFARLHDVLVDLVINETVPWVKLSVPIPIVDYRSPGPLTHNNYYYDSQMKNSVSESVSLSTATICLMYAVMLSLLFHSDFVIFQSGVARRLSSASLKQ